jgi:hypothetical protein
VSVVIEDDGELSEEEFLAWLNVLDSSEDVDEQGEPETDSP